MIKDDIESRLAKVITEENLLTPGQAVLVGVSGGADSVCLLHMLYWLSQQDNWSLKLHVAHLNHQLRGKAADADAASVQKLAKKLCMPCTVESADVAKRSEADGISIEQAGRLCRLEYFERLCLAEGIKAVAVAHNADDHAETVFHRVIRGTGIRGLVGIRPQRAIRQGSEIRLIRPILRFRRAEIEQYLDERGLSYCHDATNESDEYTRNRIRNEVLPMLAEKFNPQVTEALIRLADQAAGLDSYLTETGERMLESLIIHQDDQQLVLHSPSLVKKARVIQTQLIRQAILRMGIAEGELSYGHLNSVADLAASQEGTKAIDLPSSLRVSRRYSRLVFERTGSQRTAIPAATEIRVAWEGTTLLADRNMEIITDIISADEETVDAHLSRAGSRESGQLSYEEWLDADRVRPPLLARTRKPGDRFFPLGMSGMKKLSDFFIDEKVDAGLRERTVVLCDQLGPIWIVPFRIDERVRLTRATKSILRLRARITGSAEH